MSIARCGQNVSRSPSSTRIPSKQRLLVPFPILDYRLKHFVSPAVGECSETDAMLKYCALSCGVCEPDEDEACKDEHENCAFWQSHGKIHR
jgi:ShK domain-like